MGNAPGQADDAGAAIVKAAVVGAAVFSTSALLAIALRPLTLVALVVALSLFVGGVAGFALSFVIAVARSRREKIGVLAMYFLEGSVAPPRVRRLLLGAFVVEIVVAAATAATRPNSSIAFGVLAPVYGLAMAGLWAARYGRFPPRAATERRAGGRP